MDAPEHDDVEPLAVAAFLVETRVRHEANRRALSARPEDEPAVDFDEPSHASAEQLRAAAALVANRQQREASERLLRRRHDGA